MHRLVEQVGWPILIASAVVLLVALPALREWVRYELRLSRRASQLRPHNEREGFPFS